MRPESNQKEMSTFQITLVRLSDSYNDLVEYITADVKTEVCTKEKCTIYSTYWLAFFFFFYYCWPQF